MPVDERALSDAQLLEMMGLLKGPTPSSAR